MDPSYPGEIDKPQDRTGPPPAKLIKHYSLGMLGVNAIGPGVFAYDVCFLFAGNNWLNAFFPFVVVPLSLVLALILNRAGRLIREGTLRSLTILRIYARFAVLFYIVVYGLSLFWLLTAKNQDILSFYLMGVIFLSAGIPFVFIFWRTLNANKWFDPAARPSELEPSVLAQ
jgi:cytochrome c biogenesis protein CcdA